MAGFTTTRRNILTSSNAMPVPRCIVIGPDTKPCIHFIYGGLHPNNLFQELFHFDTSKRDWYGNGRNDTHLEGRDVFEIGIESIWLNA